MGKIPLCIRFLRVFRKRGKRKAAIPFVYSPPRGSAKGPLCTLMIYHRYTVFPWFQEYPRKTALAIE